MTTNNLKGINVQSSKHLLSTYLKKKKNYFVFQLMYTAPTAAKKYTICQLI